MFKRVLATQWRGVRKRKKTWWNNFSKFAQSFPIVMVEVRLACCISDLTSVKWRRACRAANILLKNNSRVTLRVFRAGESLLTNKRLFKQLPSQAGGLFICLLPVSSLWSACAGTNWFRDKWLFGEGEMKLTAAWQFISLVAWDKFNYSN